MTTFRVWMANGANQKARAKSFGLVADGLTESDLEVFHRTMLFDISTEESQTPAVAPAEKASAPVAPAVTPDTFLESSGSHGRPSVPRDQWQRYKIPHPVTGVEQGWTRATTLSGTISDRTGLEHWKNARVAKGIALRPDLYAMAVATPLEDKPGFTKLVRDAVEASEANSAANMGTAVHAFTEAYDRGEPMNVPEPWLSDVKAYAAMLVRYGLRVVPEMIETIVVCPLTNSAGTLDRIVQLPDGSFVILDVKTKASMKDGRDDIAMQLAQYANATHMFIWDAAEGHWKLVPMPPVRKDIAFVAHMPVGTGRCDLWEINIVAGLEGTKICVDARTFRSRKDFARMIDPPTAAPTPPAQPQFPGAPDPGFQAYQQAHGPAVATPPVPAPNFHTQAMNAPAVAFPPGGQPGPSFDSQVYNTQYPAALGAAIQATFQPAAAGMQQAGQLINQVIAAQPTTAALTAAGWDPRYYEELQRAGQLPGGQITPVGQSPTGHVLYQSADGGLHQAAPPPAFPAGYPESYQPFVNPADPAHQTFPPADPTCEHGFNVAAACPSCHARDTAAHPEWSHFTEEQRSQLAFAAEAIALQNEQLANGVVVSAEQAVTGVGAQDTVGPIGTPGAASWTPSTNNVMHENPADNPSDPPADEAQATPPPASEGVPDTDERYDAPELHTKSWWQGEAKKLKLSDTGHRKTLANRIQAHLEEEKAKTTAPADPGKSAGANGPFPDAPVPDPAAGNGSAQPASQEIPVGTPGTAMSYENLIRTATTQDQLSQVYRHATAVNLWTPSLAQLGLNRMTELGIQPPA